MTPFRYGYETSRIVCIVVLVMVGYVSSDLAADKKECENQLSGLSPCLTFVSGQSKAPTPVCCSDLIKGYNSTKRCLCLLVKDLNTPNLGVQINATLALTLPYICHVPSPNVSACPALLHLAPNSSDAQIFAQFANSSTYDGKNTTTGGDTSARSSNTAKGRLVGLRRRVIVKVSLWLVVSIFMINLV